MNQQPSDPDSQLSDPHRGINQQANNTSIEGGMQAAQGQGNIQNQGNNNWIGNTIQILLDEQGTSFEGRTEKRHEFLQQEVRGKVLKFVKSEVVRRLTDSLHQLVIIDLSLEEQHHQVGRPLQAELAPDPEALVERVLKVEDKVAERLDTSHKTINILNQTDIGGKLLILGEPGAGKTTELLRLAKDLIHQAELDKNAPVPIIFELSAWETNNQPIFQWLVVQLKENFNISKNVGRQWLTNGKIIPLLDGLDELGLMRQVDCIRATNYCLKAEKIPYMVVCCRRKEYEEGQVRLDTMNGAVYLQPLTDDQIRKYLQDLRRPNLWKNLEQEIELKELVRSPLLLNIFVLAYQGKSITTSSELLNIYIEKRFLYAQSTLFYYFNSNFSRKSTLRYLIWLAREIKAGTKTEFLIEGLQPDVLDSSLKRKIYWLTYALMISLIWGWLMGFTIKDSAIPPDSSSFWIFDKELTFKIFAGLENGLLGFLSIGLIGIFLSKRIRQLTGLSNRLVSGLIEGIFFSCSGMLIGNIIVAPVARFFSGLFNGFVLGFSVSFLHRIELFESFSKISRVSFLKFTKFFLLSQTIGFTCTFTLFLSNIFIIQQNFELINAVIATVTTGFLTGTVIGIIFSFQADVRNKVFPNQGLWQTFRNSTILGFLGYLAYVLLSLLFSSLIGWELNQKMLWIDSLPIIIWVWVIVGGRACIQHFVLRLILFLSGSAPWNYARFLEYASRLRFIQRVGGRYRFIHKLLQDHFANMELK